MTSHSHFLRSQGQELSSVKAIASGHLEKAGLSPAELALMKFVSSLTLNETKTTRDDVEELRKAGWEDPQVAEAVYVTALFAFFNRVADAFGLGEEEMG